MPFNQLIDGSSCKFVTMSMNSLVNTTCNQTFPYLYALSILIIIIACLSFILMITTYCLTTRLQYYEYIEGDFDNFNQSEERTTAKMIAIEMEDRTNRKYLMSGQ